MFAFIRANRDARRSLSAAVLTMVTLAIGMSVACTLPTAPLPDGAQQITPPLSYAVWWQQVESCAERSGSYRAVTWYSVPAIQDQGFVHRGRLVTGVWLAHRNRILLSDFALQSPRIVRHEMLHAILRTGSHPPDYFFRRCGDWVALKPVEMNR